jgi:hypothetical protein
MDHRTRAVPLPDVLALVERRRRARARLRAARAYALGVAAAGLAGAIVLVVRPDHRPDDPVAPPPLPAAAAPAAPTTAPAPWVGSTPGDPTRGVDPLAPTILADSLAAFEDPERRVLRAEARLLAQVWGVPDDPEARAIVAKALYSGTPIDPADPDGALDLLDRFAEAGYTERDAAELADLWSTDPYSASVLGGLLLTAD